MNCLAPIASPVSLGLVIGANVQAYHANLAYLAGLTAAADKLPYFDGASSMATADFTATGRSVVAAASVAAARAVLGLDTGDTPQFAKVGLGEASPVGNVHSTAAADNNLVYADDYSTTGGHTNYWFSRRSHSNTKGTLATTLTDDFLGVFYFQGVNSLASAFQFGAQIYARQNGTAAGFVPTDLYLNTYSTAAANTNQLVLSTTNNVGIGQNVFDGTGKKVLVIGNGTAPAAGVTDASQIYSADISAGRASPHFKTEDGDVIKLYKERTFTQTYSTASNTHPAITSAALATTSATNVTPWGYASQAQAENIATQFNLLRTDHENLKKFVNAICDHLQALQTAG